MATRAAKTAASRRARRRAAPRRSRGLVTKILVGVVGVGLFSTLAVVAQGYDAQEVPPLESAVWVTRDTGQYARVNTELAEIDTVRPVDDPSGVAQFGADGMVFTQGFGRLWPIDAANPQQLLGATGTTGASAGSDDTDASGDSGGTPAADPAPAPAPATGAIAENTPGGTRTVVTAGSYVAYLTDLGRSYIGQVPDGQQLTTPILIDPYRDVPVEEGVEQPSFVATAIGIDDAGQVALYSGEDATIVRFDAVKDEFLGDPIPVTGGPASDARVSLTMVGGSWVLSEPAEGRVWIDGRDESIDTGLGAQSVLQTGSQRGNRVYVADTSGLAFVDLDTGAVTYVVDGAGVPAAPTVVDGVVYAAWLAPQGGSMWSSDGDGGGGDGTALDLQLDGAVLDDVDVVQPVIRSNGRRAVLNETSSGMLWTIPDGQLIPVEQWSIDDEEQDEGTIIVDDVAEQKPPVAVADSFGVRSGSLVVLPMLLNDHDPNKRDVLTIAPETVTGLDGAFGTLSLVSNNQQGAVRVTAASGSASFSYAVTDGVSVSPPVTVTLTVIPTDVNTPPEWCGVDNCVQDWPSPGMAAGGTVTVPVLPGWVDREGDLFVLSDATADDIDAPVTVIATADGEVVIRHQDANAPDSTIVITVSLMDAYGAVQTKKLEVRVTANPPLIAEPIAAVAGAGEKVTVDITDSVRGGSGSYRITDAVETSASAEGLVVVPNIAAGQVDFSASAAGDYVVTYTVQDAQTLAQQSAILRITVVAAGIPLAIAPLTAFVRPDEDATVDVLGAVQNTSGRVLLVSEAKTVEPNLSLSVVGQSSVRVSGSTTDGAPGRIGSAAVTVTDGAGNTVVGQLTVFLVPAAIGLGPIAVPDTVTVRAGQQVDIPVAENDVTPRGERLVIHPEIEGSGTAGELAFVAGDALRYLAPPVPGVYTLRYSAYLENEPDRLDRATVTVTVIPSGSNRAPQPPILTSRVLAGQSVAIPFTGFGVDPDGDRVFLVDVDQPDAGQGVAAVSAEGDAITYTAPGDGVSGGQLTFGYRVRDSQGAVAEGIVRIGVLDADLSDVAPVTYSDYVTVQVSAAVPLTINPMLNDRDPAQGALKLQSLVPNAAPGSPQYALLESLIDPDTDLDAGTVVLAAGNALGVNSYIYTVFSDRSFSTAEGLIVINVTSGQAPDVPVVTDSYVTARNRGDLADGIDVVTDKVQWPTGDVGDLKLALWGGAASRYTVSGSSISGELPADGDVVPFSLTGRAGDGSKVVSYGFLWIPPFDDMRVQLRSGLAPIEVPEEESLAFAIRDLLDLDKGDTIELRDDSAYTVQRDNATCSRVSATRVEYDAGREAPWQDTCTVPIRINGQKTWTLLGIPVVILPKDPQAILTSVSRTVVPGGRDEVDLYGQMTTWEGGREGDTSQLDYRILYTGAAFTVAQVGNTVTIDTDADARPGTRETIQVSTTGFGGLAAGISLVVGIAPPDAPRGATFGQQCNVSSGPSCTIQVTPKTGEYDPFAGKVGSGLKLVSVGGGSGVQCAVASVQGSGEREVVATWPAGPKPVGGECVVPYTVADAQNRTGGGTVTIDVLGFPQVPATVNTVAYTGDSVTLSIPLGDAAQAHPSVTAVALYENRSPVPNASCAAGGPGEYRCTVSGLVNGERHTFTARAVNSVGESLDTTPHTTSAYQKPVVQNATAEPVYRAGVTSQGTGVIVLSITSSDDAQSYRVSEGGNSRTITRTGNVTTADLQLSPGNHTLEIVPLSRFSPPIGSGNEGDVRTVNVLVAGAPFVTASGSASPTATSVTLSGASVDGNSSAKPLQQRWVAWIADEGAPSCQADGAGNLQLTGGGGSTVQSGSSTVSGLQENQTYRIALCASNGFGAVLTAPQEQFTFSPPSAPTGTLTYTVQPSYRDFGNQVRYTDVTGPSVAAADKPRYDVWYIINGNKTTNFAFDPATVPSISVLYCFQRDSNRCSATSPVTAAGPPAKVVVQFPGSCQAEGTSGVTVQGAANGSQQITVGPKTGSILFGYRQPVTVQWTGAYATLQEFTKEVSVCYTPPPDPDPEPEPTDPPVPNP